MVDCATVTARNRKGRLCEPGKTYACARPREGGGRNGGARGWEWENHRSRWQKERARMLHRCHDATISTTLRFTREKTGQNHWFIYMCICVCARRIFLEMKDYSESLINFLAPIQVLKWQDEIWFDCLFVHLSTHPLIHQTVHSHCVYQPWTTEETQQIFIEKCECKDLKDGRFNLEFFMAMPYYKIVLFSFILMGNSGNDLENKSHHFNSFANQINRSYRQDGASGHFIHDWQAGISIQLLQIICTLPQT